jgi:hypothetical protein
LFGDISLSKVPENLQQELHLNITHQQTATLLSLSEFSMRLGNVIEGSSYAHGATITMLQTLAKQNITLSDAKYPTYVALLAKSSMTVAKYFYTELMQPEVALGISQRSVLQWEQVQQYSMSRHVEWSYLLLELYFAELALSEDEEEVSISSGVIGSGVDKKKAEVKWNRRRDILEKIYRLEASEPGVELTSSQKLELNRVASQLVVMGG